MLVTIGNSEISTHTSTRLLKPNWNQKPISGTMARIGIVCSTTAHGYSDHSIQRAWIMATGMIVPMAIDTSRPTIAT